VVLVHAASRFAALLLRSTSSFHCFVTPFVTPSQWNGASSQRESAAKDGHRGYKRDLHVSAWIFYLVDWGQQQRDVMSNILTPKKTDRGWVVEMPLGMTQALGVSEGSLAVLHSKQGGMEVEILPPASKEIRDAARRILDKHKDEFEEMKRFGD